VVDRNRGEGIVDAREDLRATSEAIQADAERIAGLEVRKRSLDAADPEVVELSREIETLTRGMADKAAAERELSEEIQA
jgi:hypothetical protein